jgi:hypothetical protein
MDLTGVGAVIAAGATVGGLVFNVVKWRAERRERRRFEPPTPRSGDDERSSYDTHDQVSP